MGEIRYIIGKVERGKTIENVVDILQNSIPLSELKRRIDYIRSTASDWMEYDVLIGVLLHGEEQPWPCPANILKMRGKEQDIPNIKKNDGKFAEYDPEQPDYDGKYPKDFNKPDEWETWVQRMPENAFKLDWQQWFREMPRKEQP